jgi:fermentation-respiration switch protein FrsA (DUF1100 family)
MKTIPFATLPLVLASVVGLPQGLINPPIAQAQVFVSGPVQAVNTNQEKLFLNHDTVAERSLTVGTATTINGRSIPAGAVIRGQFEPVPGGLRYVATSVEVGNQIYPLQASSEVLHDVKDPRETTGGAIARDAAIGAAGGAALGGIFGRRVSIGSIVGGAAAGAIVGNTTAQRVVVIEPNQAITLQVQ